MKLAPDTLPAMRRGLLDGCRDGTLGFIGAARVLDEFLGGTTLFQKAEMLEYLTSGALAEVAAKRLSQADLTDLNTILLLSTTLGPYFSHERQESKSGELIDTAYDLAWMWTDPSRDPNHTEGIQDLAESFHAQEALQFKPVLRSALITSLGILKESLDPQRAANAESLHDRLKAQLQAKDHTGVNVRVTSGGMPRPGKVPSLPMVAVTRIVMEVHTGKLKREDGQKKLRELLGHLDWPNEAAVQGPKGADFTALWVSMLNQEFGYVHPVYLRNLVGDFAIEFMAKTRKSMSTADQVRESGDVIEKIVEAPKKGIPEGKITMLTGTNEGAKVPASGLGFHTAIPKWEEVGSLVFAALKLHRTKEHLPDDWTFAEGSGYVPSTEEIRGMNGDFLDSWFAVVERAGEITGIPLSPWGITRYIPEKTYYERFRGPVLSHEDSNTVQTRQQELSLSHLMAHHGLKAEDAADILLRGYNTRHLPRWAGSIDANVVRCWCELREARRINIHPKDLAFFYGWADADDIREGVARFKNEHYARLEKERGKPRDPETLMHYAGLINAVATSDRLRYLATGVGAERIDSQDLRRAFESLSVMVQQLQAKKITMQMVIDGWRYRLPPYEYAGGYGPMDEKGKPQAWHPRAPIYNAKLVDTWEKVLKEANADPNLTYHDRWLIQQARAYWFPAAHQERHPWETRDGIWDCLDATGLANANKTVARKILLDVVYHNLGWGEALGQWVSRQAVDPLMMGAPRGIEKPILEFAIVALRLEAAMFHRYPASATALEFSEALRRLIPEDLWEKAREVYVIPENERVPSVHRLDRNRNTLISAMTSLMHMVHAKVLTMDDAIAQWRAYTVPGGTIPRVDGAVDADFADTVLEFSIAFHQAGLPHYWVGETMRSVLSIDAIGEAKSRLMAKNKAVPTIEEPATKPSEITTPWVFDFAWCHANQIVQGRREPGTGISVKDAAVLVASSVHTGKGREFHELGETGFTKDELLSAWTALFQEPATAGLFPLHSILHQFENHYQCWRAYVVKNAAPSPAPADWAWDSTPSTGKKALETLKADAAEIVLRTGVKRIRAAAGTHLGEWWSRAGNPQRAGETPEAWATRRTDADAQHRAFLATEAGQSLVAMVVGFAWTAASGSVPNDTVREFGDKVARELRVSAGTDLLDGFLEEVFEPMVETVRDLPGVRILALTEPAGEVLDLEEDGVVASTRKDSA